MDTISIGSLWKNSRTWGFNLYKDLDLLRTSAMQSSEVEAGAMFVVLGEFVLRGRGSVEILTTTGKRGWVSFARFVSNDSQAPNATPPFVRIA